MRTLVPIAIVLAFALTAAFFAGSGFNSIVDGGNDMQDLQDNVDDSVNVTRDSQVSGDRGRGESSIVGIVIGSASVIRDLVGLALLLPIKLESIGFPRWFAFPVGSVLEIVLIVGFVQFVTGRVWQ